MTDAAEQITEAIERLHRSGWSIGSVAFHNGAGGLLWLVTGSNGENLIRAEGVTEPEAWLDAIEQARGVGMLSHSTRPPLDLA